MFVSLAILLTLAAGVIAYARKTFGIPGSLLLLTAKLLAGSVAIFFYLKIAGEGDIVYYHERATYYLAAIKSGYPFWDFLAMEADPSGQATPQDRTLFFIKLLTFLYEPLAANPWFVNIFFSLVSFLAVTYFIRNVRYVAGDMKWPVVLVCILWPSVAVWGSGLSKESAMLSSLLFFWGGVIPVIGGDRRNRLQRVTIAALSFFLLARLRFFVVLALLPTVLAYFLLTFLERADKKSTAKWMIGLAGAGAIALLVIFVSYLDSSFNPGFFFKAFQANHAAIVHNSPAGHVVTGLDHLLEWPWIVFQFLLAAIAGTVGPLPWEVNTWWEALLLGETMLLGVVFFTNSPPWQRFPRKLWLPILGYVVLTAAIITLSTPNYGSISRYRLVYYPLLIFAAVYKHPLLSKYASRLDPKAHNDV